MRFLAVFMAVLAALALLYGGVIHLVDPHGQFGTGVFPPIELDTRAEKMRLFQAYRAQAAPEGLILGSSRAMKVCPRTLESVTGHRFFNFSVDNVRAEDYLAIYRWVRQQGVRVKALVVGLDVEALHNDDRPEPTLLQNDALMRALGQADLREPGLRARLSQNALARRLKKYKATVTIQSLADAGRSVFFFAHPQSRPLPMMEFEPDGYLRYRRWERERAAGTFRFDRDLERCLTKSLTRFDDMTELSGRRRAYLRQLVDEARRDGARVLVWITSLHPLTARYLEARTGYANLLAAMRDYQEALALSDGATVYDFSQPDSYQGTASGWYDCLHIDETNADRVAVAMAGELR